MNDILKEEFDEEVDNENDLDEDFDFSSELNINHLTIKKKGA